MEGFAVLKEGRADRKDRKNNMNFEPPHPWSKHLYGSNCEVEQPNQAIMVVTDGVPDR